MNTLADTYLFSLNHWFWLTSGIILMTLEMILPTQFLLWVGVAAMICGGITALTPGMDWTLQLLIFALSALICLWLSRFWLQRTPIISSAPLLNQRGKQYIGRRFYLREPIVNGAGSIAVDDSIWRVSGPDLPFGQQVKVIDCDGTTLIVAPIRPADSGHEAGRRHPQPETES